MQVFTTMIQSQKNIFSSRLKRTVILYWNLGISEFPLFVLFFNLLLRFPRTNFSTGLDGAGSIIQCLSLFIYCCFNLQVKKSFMKMLHLNGVPKRVLTDLFCWTILMFAKLRTLKSFNPLPYKHWRSAYSPHPPLPPHDFSVEQEDNFSPL